MNPLNADTYRIFLEPDLARFRFSGRAEIDLVAPAPVDEIVLDLLEIAVWQCELSSGEAFEPCAFAVDPRHRTLTLVPGRKISGTFTVRITYEGVINDRMAGFYRSHYTHGQHNGTIAVTQFQESDARRAFPCIDHPQKKAVFELEMVVDPALTPIANMPVVAEKLLTDGRKRVRFAATPKMSTYLVFFGLGDFSVLTDSVDQRVRSVMLPGSEPYVAFGLEFGRKALAYSEQYYGIAYPLAKMDLIAVPDFAFGAMENWGAITFRENLLLYDPQLTSGAAQERICEVIAHEIAHQWFGNLVTPSDWKYIWLNESFATYFGFGVVAHYYPEWRTWDQFLAGETESAMNRDSLHETFAIEIPGDEQVAITAGTAPIIYSKGGSILRQVHAYVGAENFQAGLRAYLKTHEYGCADSHHLWEALEAASQKPVNRLMKAWVEQPGHPLIEAQRKGANIELRQQRFTYLPNQDANLWPIPIAIDLFDASGSARRVETLLTERSTRVAIDPDTTAFKINADQTGFYRVRYTAADDLDALGRLIAQQHMNARDRWGVQNDLYALVKGGLYTLGEYLEFLKSYDREAAFLPDWGIASNLAHAHLVTEGSARDTVAAAGRAHAEKVLARIGLEPQPDEPHPTAILRDRVLGYAAVYDTPTALEFIDLKFAALTAGDPVHRDILKSICQGAAGSVGQGAFDWLTTRLEATHSEHERMNILVSLGCFRTWQLQAEALEYVLEHVPDRNKFIPIVSAAANPWAMEKMWHWYREHLDRLESFHPLLYERVIQGIVPLAGMSAPAEVREFFSTYRQTRPQAADVIDLSLEKLAVNLQMRDR